MEYFFFYVLESILICILSECDEKMDIVSCLWLQNRAGVRMWLAKPSIKAWNVVKQLAWLC